ncbi:MlaD family protein [Rhabdobacter roseus]|uniref:Phospholipid/cholesterol/gamma-HCH transport system substrate-binding protein n=1 Tax=Rhabdobacter roseus TaxID=1655419 RepID=A0A840TMM2_9BACT|nr:MlaD family protein [Rhabdobacter roseus]MBB5284871.1 phospholipid/cholesterol/gamma-HCH transport system substrate-binding protein [Rhabdobacter roseus]
MKISKEVKVAALVIVTLTMLYFGFNFLKGTDLFSRTHKYFIVYDDVDGLTASNPVMLNGLSVGRVQTIKILQDQGNRLLVTVDIQKEIQIREGTVATLADGGLLGGKVIQLKIANSGRELGDEDTLVAQKDPGISALLQEKALPVVMHADSLVRNLTLITAGFKETGAILNQVLRNYDQTGLVLRTTLETNQANLAALTGNLSKLTASLIETEKELKPILAKAGTFTDSLTALRLGETVATANRTIGELQQMLAAVKAGQGTAGKLVSDDKLYNNLNYSLISLNQLLANFREQPRRYINVSVFGGKKKDTGPSESPIDTTLQFKEN